VKKEESLMLLTAILISALGVSLIFYGYVQESKESEVTTTTLPKSKQLNLKLKECEEGYGEHEQDLKDYCYASVAEKIKF
jgi:hypothetical protein